MANIQLLEKLATARMLLSMMVIQGELKKNPAIQNAITLAKDELEVSTEDPTDNQLIEKIAKAKIHLPDYEFGHTCMIDMDPDYMGPCGCGADKNNEILKKVKRALDLSK
jgi:hypothetical protein